jgi:hypothetical protein
LVQLARQFLQLANQPARLRLGYFIYALDPNYIINIHLSGKTIVKSQILYYFVTSPEDLGRQVLFFTSFSDRQLKDH